MQGVAIRMAGDKDFAGAIAEGMVRAENNALKETIAMLLKENDELRNRLGLLEWQRNRSREDTLCEFAGKAKKATRCPMWARIALSIRLLVNELR